NDPGLAALAASGAPAVCIVGKSWRFQAETALGVDGAENLAMIADSLRMLGDADGVRETLFDAEHFFDGYKNDPDYALACLRAARDAGARWIVLCDTNGGTLPHEVREIVDAALEAVPGDRLGVHFHNDAGCAAANTLTAVERGARHVQGTLNGLGERCGNADLITLLPTLILKMGLETGVAPEDLPELPRISRMLDERLNRSSNPSAPYVGENAFAHKGGLHVSGVAKDPRTYEHIDPALVGAARMAVVSNQAGRANLLARLEDVGLSLAGDDRRVEALLAQIKDREHQGYAYDAAEASFELLARRTLGERLEYFQLERFRALVEHRFNARGEQIAVSEVTVKITVHGVTYDEVAEGVGPVDALDRAMRKALARRYPLLDEIRLVDFKVRIIAPEEGTEASTRVMIESIGGDGQRRRTVGVSGNLIEAAYIALEDAYVDGLRRAGVPAIAAVA
ncbi:MAG: citramalate synthase, partial [Pseudomonadota bacterium]